jgi:hypothetical protein
MLLFASASACAGPGGNTNVESTNRPPLIDDPQRREDTLGLGEMRIFAGSDEVVRIHADGETEYASRSKGDAVTWKSGPTLAADGTISYDGQADSRLSVDGTLVNVRSGKVVPIRITADSATQPDGSNEVGFRLAKDGTLDYLGDVWTPRPPVRVEGADTPSHRRTVLAVMAAVFWQRGGVGVEEPEAP